MNNGLMGLGQLHHLRPFLGEGGGDQEAYALVLAQGASGSEGGALTGPGTWDTLTLTRVVQDDQELVVKLGPSGGIIVRAGRYRAASHCTCSTCEGAGSRLYDVRFGRTVGYCPSFSGTAGRLTTATLLTDDEFTVFTESEILLQQTCSQAQASTWARGMGFGTGDPEVFGAVELWRLVDR
jgi:hypothetical protein